MKFRQNQKTSKLKIQINLCPRSPLQQRFLRKDPRIAQVKGSRDCWRIPGPVQLYIVDSLSFYFFQRTLCIQLHYTHLPNKFFKNIFFYKNQFFQACLTSSKLFPSKKLFIEFKSFVKFPFTFSHEKWRDKQVNHLWQNKTCHDKAWKAHFI